MQKALEQQQLQLNMLAQQQQNALVQQMVRDELARVQQQHQKAPMQFIINNHSEANVSQSASAPPAHRSEELRPVVSYYGVIAEFLASPMNRLGLFTVVGLG